MDEGDEYIPQISTIDCNLSDFPSCYDNDSMVYQQSTNLSNNPYSYQSQYNNYGNYPQNGNRSNSNLHIICTLSKFRIYATTTTTVRPTSDGK